MYDGKLNAVVDEAGDNDFMSDPDQPWEDGGDTYTNEYIALLFGAYEVIEVDGVIDSLDIGENEDIEILYEEGDGDTIDYQGQYPIIIIDGDGNPYLVDEDGEITEITPELIAAAEAERGGGTPQTVTDVDSMLALLSLVHFVPTDDMKYGFDSLRYEGLANQYSLATILEENVRLPYKAVATGEMDYLEALIPALEGIDVSAMTFSLNGTPLTSQETGEANNQKLSFTTQTTDDIIPLEVFYNMQDTAGETYSELIGQVNLAGYEKQYINLYIVPVNTDRSQYDEAAIRQEVNRIYSQAVTEWNVTLHETLYTDEWDINENGIFDNTDPDERMLSDACQKQGVSRSFGAGRTSPAGHTPAGDYTPAMKKVYKAFKDEFDHENNAVYVFLIPGTTADPALAGFMPFQKQYAFVFTNNLGGNETQEHAIAHEIAHGTFNLRHTFSTENAYTLSQGSTYNLMDYSGSSATELNKYQWDFIHDPETVLFSWLEDEEEGESSKRKWEDILEGSLRELGIRPGYYIVVNENTGETKIIREYCIILEQEENTHLKLIDVIKIYEFKCPSVESSEEYFSSLLESENITNILQGICPHYPHSMHEYRTLCETWLTNEKTIFINGELEGIRGVDFNESCSECETNYPSYFFMKPEEMMNYASAKDPLVTAFYEVLKSNAKRIMNDDIKYNELSEEEIGQFFINLIPDILDFFFTDIPMPYGSFGPSYFIKDKLPDIDDENTFYIPTDEIENAINYFNGIKDEYYIDPDNIQY